MVTSVYCWGKIWSMQNRAKTKRKLHYTYIILNPNIFQSFGNFVFRNKVETGERSVCLGKYPLVNTKATDGQIQGEIQFPFSVLFLVTIGFPWGKAFMLGFIHLRKQEFYKFYTLWYLCVYASVCCTDSCFLHNMSSQEIDFHWLATLALKV